MIIKMANINGPATSFVDSVMIFTLLLNVRFSFHNNLLYAFSVTTIAASTIVHIAIAIQPSDMIFEGIWNNFIHKNVISIPTTNETAVISDAQKFHKNRNNIITVIINSAVSIELSV
jgi:hypothetical protein